MIRLKWVWLVAIACSVTGMAMAPRLVSDRLDARAARALERREPDTASVDASPESAWALAPFRPDRTPAASRYSPAEGEPNVDERPPDRPAWRLTGVVQGPAPVALFEGVDGRGAGTVLMALGDSVGSFRLVAIRGDTAVVASTDGEWPFVLEATWR